LTYHSSFLLFNIDLLPEFSKDDFKKFPIKQFLKNLIFAESGIIHFCTFEYYPILYKNFFL